MSDIMRIGYIECWLVGDTGLLETSVRKINFISCMPALFLLRSHRGMRRQLSPNKKEHILLSILIS